MLKRSTAILTTLAVIALPGGSLIVGAMWLYRYVRLAGSRSLDGDISTSAWRRLALMQQARRRRRASVPALLRSCGRP